MRRSSHLLNQPRHCPSHPNPHRRKSISPSRSLPCRSLSSPNPSRRRRASHMSWCRSTSSPCRSTGRTGSGKRSASRSLVQHWPTGSSGLPKTGLCRSSSVCRNASWSKMSCPLLGTCTAVLRRGHPSRPAGRRPHRPQELDVQRLPERSKSQRRCLQHHRACQGQRPEPVPVSQVPFRAPAKRRHPAASRTPRRRLAMERNHPAKLQMNLLSSTAHTAELF